jgi:hypothetical protein
MRAPHRIENFLPRLEAQMVRVVETQSTPAILQLLGREAFE